jgi:PKD repeat protein
MTYQRSGAGYIARSTDDGVTWDTLQTLVNSSARLPRLSKRESDGLYVVSYQKSIGGNNMGIYAKASYDPYDWNVPEVAISNQVDSHDSQPIVLEDGTLVIFYASRPVLYYDIHYRTSADGLNWSVPVQLTNDPTRYDTQPHPLLHGTPGRVILVWPHQDDNNPTPYVDHDVWVNTDVVFVPDLAGSSKDVEPAVVAPTGLLTYTLFLDNDGHRATTAVLADPLPPHTVYYGGLWASSGTYGYDGGNDLITWTGTISTVSRVTMTFVLSTTPDLGDGEIITNTAFLTDGEGLAYALVAAAIGDALPPASAITDPVEAQVISSTTYLVHGVATDTVSPIEAVVVSVDGGPWEPATGGESWTYSWSGYADGTHNLRSQAVDTVGHVESPGAGITVTVDATPPEVLAYLPPAGAVEVPLATTVVVTFSEAVVTDTLVYTCAPNPGGWAASWDAERTTVFLTHDDLLLGQTYTFTVLQARDEARNPLAPVGWSFTTVAPPCAPVEILSVTTTITDCQVTFGAELTGTAPFAYLWDFGWDTSTETNPLVDFGASGTYPYTLTVSNCETYSDTAGGVVTVTCTPPCEGPAGVDLAYTPAEPLVHATVYFTGSVLSGTAPFTYSWDFGDGGTAEGMYVSHSFDSAGTYTTTLTVSNACGEASREHIVLVALYRIYLPVVRK